MSKFLSLAFSVVLSSASAMPAFAGAPAAPSDVSLGALSTTASPMAGAVYPANEDGNTPSAIAPPSQKIETVSVPITPHNVQVSADGRFLLAVGGLAAESVGHGHDEERGMLLVFDAGALNRGPVASVKVGRHPAHVVADPQARRAFVTNADDDTVVAMRVTSKKASQRIAEYAFRTAEIRNGKRKVVAVHKANVLRKGDGLFASVCREVAKKYPKIQYSELYVDAASMNLIRNPEDFDVIVTTNLFGDILSDEAAQVVGGLGMGPAANIGEHFALFEPVHGAAFDIAGKNAANPSSILLSARMMTDWLADRNKDSKAAAEGRRIEDAIVKLLSKNQKTKDIGGTLTTTQFADLVAKSMY